MADNLTIEVSPRENLGKGHNRRLRRSQLIPGVIYGSKKDTQNIAVENRILSHAAQSESFTSQIIDLDVDGQSEQVVVRDVQRHPSTDQIIHVDFLRIDQDREITMSVPIRFLNENECVGVRLSGGTISRNLIEVEVSCLPRHLPENIEVDLQDLDLGESVHLSDLGLPEGVRIAAFLQGESQDRDLPIASVNLQRVEVEEELTEEELEGEEVEGLAVEEGEQQETTGEAEADEE